MPVDQGERDDNREQRRQRRQRQRRQDLHQPAPFPDGDDGTVDASSVAASDLRLPVFSATFLLERFGVRTVAMQVLYVSCILSCRAYTYVKEQTKLSAPQLIWRPKARRKGVQRVLRLHPLTRPRPVRRQPFAFMCQLLFGVGVALHFWPGVLLGQQVDGPRFIIVAPTAIVRFKMQYEDICIPHKRY